MIRPWPRRLRLRRSCLVRLLLVGLSAGRLSSGVEEDAVRSWHRGECGEQPQGQVGRDLVRV